MQLSHYTQTAIVKKTSESKNCMHNQWKGLGGNLANLPVKIREFLRQFQVVIAMIMMTTTLRFVVFKIGHKALYGVLNRRNQIISENSCEIYANKRVIQFSMVNPKLKHHKALCGVLNRPQSALWCFE